VSSRARGSNVCRISPSTVFTCCSKAETEKKRCLSYVPHYAILKVPNFVLEVSYNKFTCIQGQKTHCSHNIVRFDQGSSLIQGSILLWLVSWPSVLWLVDRLQHASEYIWVSALEASIALVYMTAIWTVMIALFFSPKSSSFGSACKVDLLPHPRKQHLLVDNTNQTLPISDTTTVFKGVVHF